MFQSVYYFISPGVFVNGKQTSYYIQLFQIRSKLPNGEWRLVIATLHILFIERISYDCETAPHVHGTITAGMPNVFIENKALTRSQHGAVRFTLVRNLL